ncbi:MAG TPA: SWIM zinc finger family protein [Acidimicrobiales bacterium]|nr:SWIM zinc finger family protein [Acidimicrobiales bacterium]
MSRRLFGATWWGRQWVEALEQRASLDPNRLPRGRSYARAGAVGELVVTPGEVSAPVHGSRRTPYQVHVRVRQFSPDEWAAVMDALAERLGHAAALLEGELLPEVAGDVRAVGLDLLPGAGQVQPRCSCPDWADPCKHSAAVCYLVADELDRDPFVLFLLRGKSREELLSGVRRRRSLGATGSQVTADLGTSLDSGWEQDAGIPARQAWAPREQVDPIGLALPAPPRHPGRPPLVLDPAPPGSGVNMAGLAALATDAARRAWALATGGGPCGPELTFQQDCARWAASIIDGSPAPLTLEELARRVGAGQRELFLWGLAWRVGGPGALAALVEPWQPPPSELRAGRELLGPGSRVSANRVTLGDRQLRLGRDGKWYSYRKARGAWQPERAAESLAGD